MAGRKIQDEGEVIRWFEEGRTYAWMAEQYRKKYHIDTVPSMWGNFRRRRGSLDGSRGTTTLSLGRSSGSTAGRTRS